MAELFKRINMTKRMQAETARRAGLVALLSAILDRAFKGEL